MTSFGLHLTDFSQPRFAGNRLLGAITEITTELERQPAFTHLWVTDHVQSPGPAGAITPMPEAYSLLNAIAVRTSRLELGVLATSVLYRRPEFLANLALTLDALSGGRAILGIGAGHPRTEAEHVAYGYEFPAVPKRMELLDHALDLIKPKIDAIPVLVAGSGEQQLLRIAARHADMINLSFPSGDTIDRIDHKRDVLAAHCADIGRDPAEVSVTYKAVMAVAETSRQAHADWDSWRSTRGFADANSHSGVFIGTPDDISEQLAPWLRVGIDQFVLEFARTDADSIALAGSALNELDTVAGAR